MEGEIPRAGLTGLALLLASTSFIAAPALAQRPTPLPLPPLGGHIEIGPRGNLIMITYGPDQKPIVTVLLWAALLRGLLTAKDQLAPVDAASTTIGSQATILASGLALSTATPSSTSFSDPSGGAAILAGDNVANDGLIEAQLGSVVLAGTRTVTLDFTGDGMLSFAAGTAPAGSARAGTVLLTAAAAKNVLDNVINTSGIIEATSAANVNGSIVFTASSSDMVMSGTLDASGKSAAEEAVKFARQ